jgi:hypothetical protein
MFRLKATMLAAHETLRSYLRAVRSGKAAGLVSCNCHVLMRTAALLTRTAALLMSLDQGAPLVVSVRPSRASINAPAVTLTALQSSISCTTDESVTAPIGPALQPDAG